MKRPKGRKPRQSGPEADALLARTHEIFTTLDRMPDFSARHNGPLVAPAPRMALRDRKKPASPNRDPSTQRSRSSTPQKRHHSPVDNIKKVAVTMGEYTSSAPLSTRTTDGDSISRDTAIDDVLTPRQEIQTPIGTGEEAPPPRPMEAPQPQPLKIKIKIPRPSAS